MSDDIVAKVTRSFIADPVRATIDAEQLVRLADPSFYSGLYQALRQEDVTQEGIEHALRHSPKHANLIHVRAVAERPAATGFLLVYTALLEEVVLQQERYGSIMTMPLIKGELGYGIDLTDAALTMRKRDPRLYDSARLVRDYFACDTMLGSALAYGLLLESMRILPIAPGKSH